MRTPATPKTRLFSPEALVADSELWLAREQASYLTRVLRLKAEDTLVIFDGNGGQFGATIKTFEKGRVLLQVGARQTTEAESPLPIQLIQGISRGGRMDIVVQKATELGVRRITPVITEYSVVKFGGDRAERRREHWRRICRSACEQCGRNRLPDIDLPQTLQACLDGFGNDGATRLMLDPRSDTGIRSKGAPAGVALLVGPEAGLSASERELCSDSGFAAVSLGPRTLRTETAAIAGVVALQVLWGDLGEQTTPGSTPRPASTRVPRGAE